MISSRGKIRFIFASCSHIARKPQVAGKILPAISKASGSISAGNMIPESMTEGKKTIWQRRVSFDMFFTNRPKTVAMHILENINKARERKKNGRFCGTDALKIVFSQLQRRDGK